MEIKEIYEGLLVLRGQFIDNLFSNFYERVFWFADNKTEYFLKMLNLNLIKI